jgi:hypothetical protein
MVSGPRPPNRAEWLAALVEYRGHMLELSYGRKRRTRASTMLRKLSKLVDTPLSLERVDDWRTGKTLPPDRRVLRLMLDILDAYPEQAERIGEVYDRVVACGKVKGSVFISYRRSDEGAFAGRMYDRLCLKCRTVKFFFDISSLGYGRVVDDELSSAINRSKMMLVVIGKRWSGLKPGQNPESSRLNDPRDYVCREVATALDRNIDTVPILVEGAVIPVPPELPRKLEPLRGRNAVHVKNEEFSWFVDDLAYRISRTYGLGQLEEAAFD